jgi:Predicted methyltransferase (contains TPR repeat)
MDNFGKTYSKYYNLLYKDKNYQEEYIYIRNLINKYGNNNKKNILDIGCGTGKHLSFFKKDGYIVSGVDVSENMISEAKKYLQQEDDFICCKASEFKFNKSFDTVISLFHVMSYQTENDELEKVFQNISEHLTDSGLFIFDFWYGPAVLTDPPVVKIKRLEDNEVKITRITEPVMRYNENIVDVNFEVMIEDKGTHLLEKLSETHKMRYLFLPEIEMLAKKNSYEVLDMNKWLTNDKLSDTSWYGLIVLKKR